MRIFLDSQWTSLCLILQKMMISQSQFLELLEVISVTHTHTSTPSAKCIYSYRKLAGRSSDNGYRNYIIENHLYGESTFIAASSIPLCVLFHLLPDLPRHQHSLHLLLHSRHVSEEFPFLLGHGGAVSDGWKWWMVLNNCLTLLNWVKELHHPWLLKILPEIS